MNRDRSEDGMTRFRRLHSICLGVSRQRNWFIMQYWILWMSGLDFASSQVARAPDSSSALSPSLPSRREGQPGSLAAQPGEHWQQFPLLRGMTGSQEQCCIGPSGTVQQTQMLSEG